MLGALAEKLEDRDRVTDMLFGCPFSFSFHKYFSCVRRQTWPEFNSYQILLRDELKHL